MSYIYQHFLNVRFKKKKLFLCVLTIIVYCYDFFSCICYVNGLYLLFFFSYYLSMISTTIISYISWLTVKFFKLNIITYSTLFEYFFNHLDVDSVCHYSTCSVLYFYELSIINTYIYSFSHTL